MGVLSLLIRRVFVVRTHVDLLDDLNGAISNSKTSSQSSIRLRDSISFLLEARINLQIQFGR